MRGPRVLQMGVCLLLLVMAAVFLPIEAAELLRYEKLSGRYEAYLLRYELDGFAPRPERHKHPKVLIRFEDGTRVEFRSPRSGRYEWLKPGEKLDILVNYSGGSRKPEYEVNSFPHLYLNGLIFVGVGVIALIGLLSWPKDPKPGSNGKSNIGGN